MTNRSLLCWCLEGDKISYDGQEWRVGPIEQGMVVLYGITRRKRLLVPGTMMIQYLS